MSGMSTSGSVLWKITCAPWSVPCAERRVSLEQVPRDRPPLDLIGSLVDPVDANIPHHPLDWHLFGVPHPAVDLHHAVDDSPDHAGAGQFRDRRFVPDVAALVGLPGGVEHQPLHLLDLDSAV